MEPYWLRGPGFGLIGAEAAAHAVDVARHAERRGFGSLWIAEDYFFPSAFPVAAAAAVVTKRLVVATGVVNPYTRHPALLAMEAATLSVLAPGRCVLGLGASLRRWIEDQMGIPFTRPLGTLKESVEVIRTLLAKGMSDHQGPSFRLRAVRLAFEHQGPLVPIVLGMKGSRGLELAGEVADGVHLSIMTTPEHVRRARTLAERGRRAAGRLGPRLPITAYVLVSIGRSRQDARERVRPTLALYLATNHGLSILRDAGLEEAETLKFKAALERGRPASEAVTDRLIDLFAVAGTPADCQRALERLAEARLDAPVFFCPDGANVGEQIALIGRHLVPMWQGARDDR